MITQNGNIPLPKTIAQPRMAEQSIIEKQQNMLRMIFFILVDFF
jgi:hypothetical protein